MEARYTIGLDFGTSSVRALIVDVSDGSEIADSVWEYTRGENGIILDEKDANLARQHPRDYLDGLTACIRAALKNASGEKGFSPEKVIGLGIDTTGSTPLPVDRTGTPLAFHETFADNPNAMAWLWKDHTSHKEARQITDKAAAIRPGYLAKVGGTYSSEWFWAKIWHCLAEDAEVFEAAHTWVECADWIPAVITGNQDPSSMRRGICAAGHKGLFHSDWGGYPETGFLKELEPRLAEVRKSLPDEAYTVADPAGNLAAEWAEKLGLVSGIPVAVGAFDAHLGGVGSGIQPGILVKNVGTSTCDMMVAPLTQNVPDIPGLCGIVPGSILPGYHGMEAGQSAVGDIFNWFVSEIQPHGPEAGSHQELQKRAERLRAGESGLLSLDWHNGNRTILVDQRLTGMILGLTLRTTPAEIYRALIEATAFGARVIKERFEEYGIRVERVINCGGIATRNALVMQVYADVMNATMEISRSEQTGALGSAIAGSVVAGASAGGYDTIEEAISSMTGVRKTKYTPNRSEAAAYDELFAEYRKLHDSFGTTVYSKNLFGVMKTLLKIKDRVRG